MEQDPAPSFWQQVGAATGAGTRQQSRRRLLPLELVDINVLLQLAIGEASRQPDRAMDLVFDLTLPRVWARKDRLRWLFEAMVQAAVSGPVEVRLSVLTECGVGCVRARVEGGAALGRLPEEWSAVVRETDGRVWVEAVATGAAVYIELPSGE